MKQEHLIVDGTIEEKDRNALKKNFNYVEYHQFGILIFAEHLLIQDPTCCTEQMHQIHVLEPHQESNKYKYPY